MSRAPGAIVLRAEGSGKGGSSGEEKGVLRVKVRTGPSPGVSELVIWGSLALCMYVWGLGLDVSFSLAQTYAARIWRFSIQTLCGLKSAGLKEKLSFHPQVTQDLWTPRIWGLSVYISCKYMYICI